MSKKRLSADAWYWPPRMRYECVSCGAAATKDPGDLHPEECPSCGNQGQNLWPCSGCDVYVALNDVPPDWEDDVLPRCEEGHEGMLHYPMHKYVGPESYWDKETQEVAIGRCEVCGEAQDNPVHEMWRPGDE